MSNPAYDKFDKSETRREKTMAKCPKCGGKMEIVFRISGSDGKMLRKPKMIDCVCDCGFSINKTL